MCIQWCNVGSYVGNIVSIFPELLRIQTHYFFVTLTDLHGSVFMFIPELMHIQQHVYIHTMLYKSLKHNLSYAKLERLAQNEAECCTQTVHAIYFHNLVAVLPYSVYIVLSLYSCFYCKHWFGVGTWCFGMYHRVDLTHSNFVVW